MESFDYELSGRLLRKLLICSAAYSCFLGIYLWLGGGYSFLGAENEANSSSESAAIVFFYWSISFSDMVNKFFFCDYGFLISESSVSFCCFTYWSVRHDENSLKNCYGSCVCCSSSSYPKVDFFGPFPSNLPSSISALVSSSSSASSSYKELKKKVYTVWLISHRVIPLALFLSSLDFLPTDIRRVLRIMITRAVACGWKTSTDGHKTF